MTLVRPIFRSELGGDAVIEAAVRRNVGADAVAM